MSLITLTKKRQANVQWVGAFAIAILNDVIDLVFGIGSIPIFGDFIDLVTFIILIPIIGFPPALVGLLELIPLEDPIPTWILTVLLAYLQRANLTGIKLPGYGAK